MNEFFSMNEFYGNFNKDAFEVGALLYCPAINKSLVHNILNETFGNKYSICICLEDSISDNAVIDGENNIIELLNIINEKIKHNNFFIPKIFIRVRNYKQISKIFYLLNSNESIKFLTGFVAPKFSDNNADYYIGEIVKVNSISNKIIYLMPIIEDGLIFNNIERNYFLYNLKSKIDEIKKYILNIRIGGNDMCHNLGIRRNINQTIYDIKSISNILGDIYITFGRDYIISGVVWDYFGGIDDKWKEGLKKELELDVLNGFIGKTVIHPKQIEIVNESLKVDKTDFDDALRILHWSDENYSMVVKSNTCYERMNEIKTHSNWAKKIYIRSEIYGIK